MSTDKLEKPYVSVHAMTEPDIYPSDIWKGDCFNRQKISEKLTKIACGVGMQDGERHGYVISVNGGWGTGKTFMLKRWQADLQKDNCAAIYFDAWQDDFIANPLVAIIGQLQDMLEQPSVQEVGITQKVKDGFLESAKKIRLNLSLGVLSISIPIGELSEQGEDDIVKQYHDEKEKMNELREFLGGLVAEIREHTKFPLVFIIDELDRCRPTFAIEVLERVKHLFNLPGVVFVFGINKSQLGKSIQSVYGKIDADEYLRKFFNLDLNLPVAKPSEYCKSLLAEKINFSDMKGSFNNVYAPAIDSMGLTLRQVEYFARLFELAFILEDSKKDFSGQSIVFLALLKTKYPKSHARFIHGKCKCKDVINKISSTWNIKDSKNQDEIRLFLQIGIYSLAGDDEWGEIRDDLRNHRFTSKVFADITIGEGVIKKSLIQEGDRERLDRLKDKLQLRMEHPSWHGWKKRIFGLFDFVEYVAKD